MKFYLSSYKFGDEIKKLGELMPKSNKKIGYIPNALDFSGADPLRREQGISSEMDFLQNLGFKVELVDLRDYFDKKDKLHTKINQLGGVWIRGGNTFVLRQAMKLSGFDEIIKAKRKDNFLYGGYSAGICILAPDLRPLQIVDPIDTPYNIKEIIWEGLGILDYMILPHYKSDHPESADVDKEVKYYQKNKIPFKTLKDGEVIILDK